MANTIQHKRGSGTPAGGIARGELAIQEVAANYTTDSSSKLWIGEGSTPSLRQVGFGIYDGSTQSGIPIGGNLTFTGGTGITTTVSGAGVTHAVTAASIGDTQLAYNTGQHLTTTSAPTFATVNTGQGANELYDMNQNVKTDSAVTFATLEITGVAGSIDTEGSIYLTGDEKVVRWYEGNNYISLAAPSSVSENTDYLWPAADGTGGYQLTTDGSGNLSWAASGGTVNTADIADVSVTQTELAELETLGSTSISSTNWTALSNLTGTNSGNQTINTADIADVSVTQTELAELQTLGSTSISSTNWTALSNLTGTNSGDNTVCTSGAATTATQVYINTGDSGDTSCQIPFIIDTGGAFRALYEDSGLLYNNTSNYITANLTGNVTGDVTGNADTATTTNAVSAPAIRDATEATVATGDYFLFGDANDSDAIKKDTIQGILDLAGGGGSGTINSGATHEVAVYSGSTTLDGYTNFTYVSGTGTMNVPTAITCTNGHWELNADGLYLGVNDFITFETGASDAYEGLLKWPTVTSSDKTINLPNASGTVCVAGGTGLTLSSVGSMAVDEEQTINTINTTGMNIDSSNNIILDVGSGDQIRLKESGNQYGSIRFGGAEAYGEENSTAITTGAVLVLKSDDNVTGHGAALILHDKDNSHVTGWQAHDTTTEDLLYKMPAADGSDGQFLKTDGSGNTSWAAASGSGDIDIHGTPVNKQFAVWTDADTLKGTDKFTLEAQGLECSLALYPSPDSTYDLGMVNRQWANLYVDTVYASTNIALDGTTGADLVAGSTSCDVGRLGAPFGVCYADSFYGAGGAGTSPNGQYSPGPFLTDLMYTFSAGLVLTFQAAGSDLDIKENITSFVGPGLSLLNELSPKSFTFKEDYRTAMGLTGDAPTTYGYIAQDVQAIDAKYAEAFPDPRDEDNTILKITNEFYADVSQAQIKAIQELSAKNDALEARIAALEAA